MSYTQENLKEKLLGMYPEVTKYGLFLDLDFNHEKNAWILTFQKGDHKRFAYLDKKDADACIDGDVCIYLGMLITQYIKDLEEELAGK